MKELKTLKDIYIEPLTTIDNGKDLLREEAIKWVKEMRAIDGVCYTAEQFINHFFNLTEEDLK